MTAPAPAFHSVDLIAGLNLKHQKCCWVQYGSEGRESLCVGCQVTVMIFAKCRLSDMPSTWALDGHIHRWTAPRKDHPAF